MKSISLSDAAFAMEILDLISHVGALYGPLNFRMLPSSVHLSIMIVHINYLRLGKCVEFKLQDISGAKWIIFSYFCIFSG